MIKRVEDFEVPAHTFAIPSTALMKGLFPYIDNMIM